MAVHGGNADHALGEAQCLHDALGVDAVAGAGGGDDAALEVLISPKGSYIIIMTLYLLRSGPSEESLVEIEENY